jgi:hypothetical protein
MGRCIFLLILPLVFYPLHALPLNEVNTPVSAKQISVYKINPESKYHNYGTGLLYNTPNVKLKVEDSDTAFKTGSIVEITPFKSPLYLKIGANYLDQNSKTVNNVSQYSNGFALGYMPSKDLSVELGHSISKITGYGAITDAKSETHTTKDTYIQIGKRFETSIGTIDTLHNQRQIYNTLSKKEEESYSSSFDYYLGDKIKLNYLYTQNQNNIYNGYSVDYSYFTTEYTQNISQDSYHISMGLKANFSDILDLTSYKPPAKKKKRLLKSHKFDDVILRDNMRIRM